MHTHTQPHRAAAHIQLVITIANNMQTSHFAYPFTCNLDCLLRGECVCVCARPSVRPSFCALAWRKTILLVVDLLAIGPREGARRPDVANRAYECTRVRTRSANARRIFYFRFSGNIIYASYTCIHTRAYAHERTHALAGAHARTRAHTHTHTLR